MLKISKLSKRYNDKWVLRNVSFELKRGEVLGLLGETGCGKSTLLELISGSEKPNSGQIEFDEKDITGTGEKERRFSSPNLQQSKGWKNIFSSSKNELSDGERQVDNFQNQLKNAGSVVLLDNPFSNLDRFHKDKALEMLRNEVEEKKLIVILSTGNDEEIFSACDQAGVLNNGYIVQIDSPRRLYEKPNSVASARALGHCNFITSRRITFNNQSGLEFQTLTGDHRLQVDKTEKSTLGAITNNVSLAIRPEHISISFGASFPEDNLLKAEIIDVGYLGATTRLKLNANGLTLEALVLRLVGLNVGDECMVGLPPDRIMVLKD